MSLDDDQSNSPEPARWAKLLRLVVGDWSVTLRVCAVIVLTAAGVSIVGLANSGVTAGPVKIGCTSAVMADGNERVPRP